MTGKGPATSPGPAAELPAGSARFQPSSRLAEAAQFKRVFANPVRVGAGGLLVLARASEHPGARLGLAISKRCCPRAVDRNRLKRIARESFRAQLFRLPQVDVVVLCTPQVGKLSNHSLFAGLDRAWKTVFGKQWALP